MALFILVSYDLVFAFPGLSQRRVGVGYALRVSPAVTRLTVYRRPQVWWLQAMPKTSQAPASVYVRQRRFASGKLYPLPTPVFDGDQF